jgi:streptogramin lyase
MVRRESSARCQRSLTTALKKEQKGMHMRHRLSWAAALLCMLVITACGSTTSSGSKPSIGTLAATIHLGTAAPQAAASAQGIWFLDASDGIADEVDPASNKIVASIRVGLGITNVLATPEINALWVTEISGAVSRIDLSTGQIVATIPVSAQAVSSLTATTNPPALWVAGYTDHTITRIDMQTNRVVATIDVGNAPDDIESADGSVWVCNLKDDRAVQQLDPQTNQIVTRVTLPYSGFGGVGCGSVRFTENALWVMTYHGGGRTTVLLRLDPHTYATIATIDLGSDTIGFGIGADANAVWMSDVDTRELLRVDAQTNKVVGKLSLDQAPSRVMLTARAVWVGNFYESSDGTLSSNGTGNTLWRITPTL